MGNQASQLGDEPSSNDAYGHAAGRNIQHFDHSFKAEIHTTSGNLIEATFGSCSYAKRPIQLVCKGSSFELLEDVGVTARKTLEISYQQVTAVSWDHANSEVKLEICREEEENFVILTMANSIELEGELKLRFAGMAASRNMKIPSTMYVGMFAGATKPKPFQRKRPNLSTLKVGKLPSLHDMRSTALQVHKGSYRPCSNNTSRRLELAVQHIYEGFNTFSITRVSGNNMQHQWRPDSVIQIMTDRINFKPSASASQAIEFSYDDIEDWTAIDNEHIQMNDSGIELKAPTGETVYFGVPFIRDAKHTFEYFWNKYQTANGKSVKLGSTHGRPIYSVTTLSGEVQAIEAPQGQSECVDQDGVAVRPGSRLQRRTSTLGNRNSIVGSAATGLAKATGIINDNKEPTIVPNENRSVKGHWGEVVMHQGWLLKKGGIGFGANKSWIKRYFVLYKTSQGHFLVYYSELTECPLFSNEKGHRNVVDLAKCTFIRPGSNKAEQSDTPPYSFDIVTTEREWTLCAESQENVQKWLKLITRAVDEDVAILPDEELVFKVKPKVDPHGILPPADYTTTLKVSAFGVSVCTPEASNSNFDREHYFWVYTDFYKWSLLSQDGKMALLVNVFADSSFSRRDEYIFRNKEASRLATAIEYFIEKFMSVMHIYLETQEGAFDDVPEAVPVLEGGRAVGVQQMGENWEEGAAAEELDLLGLEIKDDVITAQVSSQGFSDNSFGEETKSNIPIAKPVSSIEDPFSADPFSLASPAPAPAPVQKPVASAADPFAADPFGISAPAPAPAPVQKPVASAADPFAADPFGLSAPAPAPAPVQKPVASAADPFAADPFGQTAPAPAPKPVPADLLGLSAPVSSAVDPFSADPFSVASPAPVAPKQALDPFTGGPAPTPTSIKTAPPLSPQQIAQHSVWYKSSWLANGGPIYDDGALQIAVKSEIRGSQGRFTFFYRNISTCTMSDVAVSIIDNAGLSRFQLGSTNPVIPPNGQGQQVLMMECMKPAFPGPDIKISYNDSLIGSKSNTIRLPVNVTSFNEPMSISANDFHVRWQQLIEPGQAIEQILNPSTQIVPAQILQALTGALRFAHVRGFPDESEFVLYGASTLRTGATTPSGEKISIGSLIKVEMNIQANAMRITVRTLHPAATHATMETFKSLLL